jgi:hypothetical protein
LVELGWFQPPGGAYSYFRVTIFNGIYNPLYGQSSISGSHTYEISYSSAYNRWDYLIDGGSLWSTHTATNGWNAAHPITNVERHSQSDTFTLGPVFNSLYYRTCCTWSTWQSLGAKCYGDNDPDLENRLPISNDYLLVAQGSGSC